MKLPTIDEIALTIALVFVVAAIVVVTIVSGADAVGGLRDLAIGLAGGLLGAKVPRQAGP